MTGTLFLPAPGVTEEQAGKTEVAQAQKGKSKDRETPNSTPVHTCLLCLVHWSKLKLRCLNRS